MTNLMTSIVLFDNACECMKRICVLLAICMYCVVMHGTIYSGTCGENAQWSFDYEKEVLMISGMGDMADFESKDKVPWKSYTWKIGKVIIGDSITSVGANSFYTLSHCTSIVLGQSLVKIQEKAFYNCRYFQQLIIPDKVKTIGFQAFYECQGITSISIGNSLESIDVNAFFGMTSLKEVQIKSLERWLKIRFTDTFSNPLYYASNLILNGQKINKLTIPEGIDSLRQNALCKVRIDTLILPSSLKYMSVNAFYSRESLQCIVVNDNNMVYDSRESCNAVIETATNTLIFGVRSSFIPSSVSCIGDSAFFNCRELHSVFIPASVQTIGKYAFNGCSVLDTLTIPNNVKEIETCAFSNCQKLRKVVLGTGVTLLNNNAFSSCTSLDSLICLSAEAPKLVDNPFYGVKSNGMIVCPKESDYTSWMTLNYNIFFSKGWRLSNQKKPADNEIWYTTNDGMIINPIINDWNNYNQYLSKMYPSVINNSYYNGLGIVRFDMSLPMIPQQCFKDKKTLTSIIIPDGIDNFGQYAFSGCTNLKSIHLPEGIQSINNYCFSGCECLDSLFIPAKLNNVSSLSFYNIKHLRKIVVSNDNETYDSRNNCNGLIKTKTNSLLLGTAETVIPHTIKSVGDYAFYGNLSMESITIPDSVESIGVEAFSGCTELKSVEFSKSLKIIGDGAFYGCKSLTFAELPNSLTQLGKGVFSGCSELVFFDIPEGIQFFPTISDCSKLKHITMGKNINYIYNGDIANCDSLQSITVSREQQPRVILNSNFHLFYRQSGGPSVLYHPANADYSSWMNSLSNFNFTEDTIPIRKNNEIWYRTSDGEPLLLNDVLCKKAISNEYKAGYGILQFDGSAVTEISKNAFRNETTLTSIIIPSTVETIGDSAFANCAELRSVTVEWETPPIISENVFDNSKCKVLYVPQNTRRLYQNAPGWNKFKRIIQPYNFVEQIKFDQNKYVVREGDTLKVNAIVFPDDAVIQNLDWFSSDESIASVKNGIVIGKKVGVVYIKAVAKDATFLKDSCLLEVTPVLAETIRLDCEKINMLRDHTAQLFAEVMPSRTTYKDVVWASSDDSVLKVESGVITALKTGVACVSAMTTDGTSLIASCEVRVEDYFPADVNWDAEYNIADVAGTVNFIMERNMEGLIFDAADMNKDGVVLVNDLKDVLDVVMNSDVKETISKLPTRRMLSYVNPLPKIFLSECTIISGGTRNLRIGIGNANLFSGIQFDLELPENVSLLHVKAGINMGNHQIVTKEISHNMIRIAVYSMNNECFSSDATDFLALEINVSTEREDIWIRLRNTIASTIYAKVTKLDDISIMLQETGITGNNNLTMRRNDVTERIPYNLNGIKVNDSYKGIVVTRKKKAFIKNN